MAASLPRRRRKEKAQIILDPAVDFTTKARRECKGMGTGKERGNEFDPYGDRADSVPVDDAEKATASALNRLLCKLLFISGRLSRQMLIAMIG